MANLHSKIVPKDKIEALKSNDCITYEEELPFPIVHYPSRIGAFFGFQEYENSPISYCSCQRDGLVVYLNNEEFATFRYVPRSMQLALSADFMKNINFVDGLCHICNKACPKYGYGKTSDGTKFHSIYGNYIKGLAFSYGINPRGIVYSPELIPADIVSQLITCSYDDNKLDEQSRIDFFRYCENVIRFRMGYFAIGERWTTEIKLLTIIKKLYPNYTVIHQYPIDHLRADIFIEELNLVIEYQGRQHFSPISFMGGDEALERIKLRDKEKVEICHYYKLGLIYFDYKEELNEKSVKEKISLNLALLKVLPKS
ncbi:hypothetical protein [Bacillus sp. MUM 13]|uniref:hypothetical protein n=1 Tax=Bacillus sp. MUM 13 TaxID=1678001 RepID=UPI0008F5D1E3|nr:hypothetical protein [Bacillus sp. MUM 13]OIK04413.1 hypothetical protein BIV59_22110 [Bacillus sp. MUM 13]